MENKTTFIERLIVKLTTLILVFSVILLQEGYSYYISFQVLALLTLIFILNYSEIKIKINLIFYISFILFAVFLLFSLFYFPDSISKNSSNIFLAYIGIIGYAFIIANIPFLIINRSVMLLMVLKNVSSIVIFVIASLILIGDMGVIQGLDRLSMNIQNSRLIDNALDPIQISNDLQLNALLGRESRIDLFYGEPSFLAIVIFVCLACFIVTSKILNCNSKFNKPIFKNFKIIISEFVVLLGLICLFYIQTFSGMIYAGIIILYEISRKVSDLKNPKFIIACILLFIIMWKLNSFEYFIQRIFQDDSLSTQERFGQFYTYETTDYLLGIRDSIKLPDVGFQNGVIYIISIAGLGGLIYIISFMYSVVRLSKSIKVSWLMILVVLAIMMQNGGVFSPSKLVLFFLALLPLACLKAYPVGCPTDFKLGVGDE